MYTKKNQKKFWTHEKVFGRTKITLTYEFVFWTYENNFRTKDVKKNEKLWTCRIPNVFFVRFVFGNSSFCWQQAVRSRTLDSSGLDSAAESDNSMSFCATRSSFLTVPKTMVRKWKQNNHFGIETPMSVPQTAILQCKTVTVHSETDIVESDIIVLDYEAIVLEMQWCILEKKIDQP